MTKEAKKILELLLQLNGCEDGWCDRENCSVRQRCEDCEYRHKIMDKLTELPESAFNELEELTK